MIKRTFIAIALLLALAYTGFSQVTSPQIPYLFRLPANPACTQKGQIYYNTAAFEYRVCTATGTALSSTWTALGSGGGGGAWGSITGTLSSQTDLQTALDGKQPIDSDLTTIGGLAPSNDDIIQRKAGAWTNRTPVQFKTDLSLGVLYSGDYGSLQLAVDALKASATIQKLVLTSDYTTTANVVIDGVNNKTIDGNNHTVTLNGSGLYGLEFKNSTGTTITNIRVVGSGSANSQTGILSTANIETKITHCSFNNLFQGWASASGLHERFSDNFVDYGTSAVVILGQYTHVTDNYLGNQTGNGVYSAGAGNFYIENNNIYGNGVGIFVDSSSGSNPDHGLISGNSINHNTSAGIYLKSLVYSMNIVGNEIWATNGANLGAAPQDSSFAIYLENVTGVGITGNTIGRNKFGIGINGIAKSTIAANRFITDTAVTTNHIKEVGGTNSFQIGANIYDGSLFGGAATVIAPSATFVGVPGGSDTQVQFNNAGSFGGSANLAWNNATNLLTVGGNFTVTSTSDTPSNIPLNFNFRGWDGSSFTTGLSINSTAGAGYYPTHILMTNAAYGKNGTIGVGPTNGVSFGSTGSNATWSFSGAAVGQGTPLSISADPTYPSITVTPNTATQNGVVVKLAASQSANAIEVQPNGSSTPLFAIDPSGYVKFGAQSSSFGGKIFRGSGYTFGFGVASGEKFYIFNEAGQLQTGFPDTGGVVFATGGGIEDTGFGRFSAGVIKSTNGSTSITGLIGGGAAVASASALPLPTGRVFHVTGTTNITSITSTNFANGVCITLIFDGILTFTNGSNLKLNSNFVTTANDTITLVYDGTNWYETSRSVN